MDTPYLQLDPVRVQANIDRVMAFATSKGLQVRPHAKTHKCPQVARMQLNAGAVGLTVATLGEAEAMADAGCTDLFIAYPLWLTDSKRERLSALASRAAVRVGMDSVSALERLAGVGVEAVLELDCGMHRSGVLPQGVPRLLSAAQRNRVDVAGVFTFPGHSYGPQARESAATQEASALAAGAEAMRAAGVEPRVISGGSSPSFAFTGGGLTETRPGVNVFNDAQQWELGCCEPDQIALWCVATVISRADGRTVLDAGSKILGADRAGYASGYGRLLDLPQARITMLSEHHTVVDTDAQLAVGDTVRVVPNHACNAVNLVTEYAVDNETWPVTARGANT